LDFLDNFSKNTQMQNVMKILLVGAEFFHVDGRKGKHKTANRRFSQNETSLTFSINTLAKAVGFSR
jgi:hypothetical protein